MPDVEDSDYIAWMTTLSNTEAQEQPPTAQDRADAQQSLRAFGLKFESLVSDHDAHLQRVEEHYKDELAKRDKIEYDLRKRLYQARNETSHLQGERDAYIKQLDAMSPPQEGRSRQRAISEAAPLPSRSRSSRAPPPSQAQSGLQPPSAAAGRNARPRSYSRPSPSTTEDNKPWRPRSQPPRS